MPKPIEGKLLKAPMTAVVACQHKGGCVRVLLTEGKNQDAAMHALVLKTEEAHWGSTRDNKLACYQHAVLVCPQCLSKPLPTSLRNDLSGARRYTCCMTPTQRQPV